MKYLLPLFAVVAIARCGPVSTVSENESSSVIKTFSDCLVSGHASLCFKEKALKITERMRSMKQLKIVDGIVISNQEPVRETRSYDSLPAEPIAREARIEEKIVDNFEDMLRNSVLQFKLPGASVPEDSTELGEGRGKKKKGDKKKKLLFTLLLKAKLFALIPVFLGIIAFTLLKSLILAKIAFIFGAVAILKKLLAKHQESKSHGWAQAASVHDHGPELGGHHEHHQAQGWENQGWDRSKVVDAQNLAYSGHMKV